jgi:hypothetical protein
MHQRPRDGQPREHLVECGKKEADHENVLVLVDALMELPWGRIANLYAVP